MISKKKEVLLVGAFGGVNLGDETILAAVLQLYNANKQNSGFSFSVFCSDGAYLSRQLREQSSPICFVSYLNGFMWNLIGEQRRSVRDALNEVMLLRNSHDFRVRMLFDTIQRADIVHICGGGYLNSAHPHIIATILAIIRLCRPDCPVFMTGIGVGPFWDNEQVQVADVLEIFHRATSVDCRDTRGEVFLAENRIPFQVTCDDAFSYEDLSLPANGKVGKKLINLQISRLWTGEFDNTQNIVDLLYLFFARIENFIADYEVSVISYASTEDDGDVCELVSFALRQKFPGLEVNIIMGEVLTLSEIVTQLRSGVLNIGCRFHFFVHSLLSGTDCVSIVGNDSSRRHAYLSIISKAGELLDIQNYDKKLQKEMVNLLFGKLKDANDPVKRAACQKSIQAFLASARVMKQTVLQRNLRLAGVEAPVERPKHVFAKNRHFGKFIRDDVKDQLFKDVLETIRREYTVMPRFGFHQPLDYQSVTLPPSFLEPVSHPSSDLPVPTGDDRFGYSPEDTEKYIWWGKLDHDLLMKVIDEHCKGAAKKNNKFAILDFGCSTGRVLRHFEVEHLEKGWNLYGCDIQTKAIQWQRQYFPPHFNVLNNSVLPHLPYEDETFDFIYGIGVFTQTKYQWDAWLMELRRVMKKGGVMMQTVHTENAWKWYADHKQESWVQANHTPRVYDTPEMDIDFLYHGDISASQVFWKSEIVKAYFGRYFRVLGVMPPPEMSFHDWVIMRKE